jgi:hypothetical protein
MRLHAKSDRNQAEIVKALRQIGADVLVLSKVGHGCPDLLVYEPFLQQLHLMEVKDGLLPPSQRKLTDDEAAFHAKWRGKIWIVNSVDDALKVVGAR